MSQTSQFLSLTLPEHGEFPNTWEIPANANFVTLDALFSGTRSDEANGTGHIHDGSDGQGPRINHPDLQFEADYEPTNTHEDIDDHIADTSTHFTVADIAIAVNNGDDDGAGASAFPESDWNNGPDGEDLITEIRFKNATITSPSDGVIVVDTGQVADGSTGPIAGVPTHLPSTHAPTVFVEDFYGPPSPLSERNWFVDSSFGNVEMMTLNGAAGLSIDVDQGSPVAGGIIHRVRTQVPHSEVQRASIFIDRVDTDDISDGDFVLIQLSLMASTVLDSVSQSRAGLFLRIYAGKFGGAFGVLRQIVHVLPAGSVVPYHSYWETASLTTLDGLLGSHEISIDRNHAIHYYYNNGPVELGANAGVGSFTNAVAWLKQALAAEYAAYSQAGGPLPIAPHYGRFGFDVRWSLAGARKTKIVLRHFSASSTDDEGSYYPTVKFGAPNRFTPDLSQPAGECCDSEDEDTLFDLVVGQAFDVPGSVDAPEGGSDEYRVTRLIPENDPLYKFRGFAVRRKERFLDIEEPEQIIYCLPMGTLSAELVDVPRPGLKECRMIVRGDRIPDLLDTPIFRPSDPDNALPTPLPNGAGAYPQAIPYPVPGAPGVLGSDTYDPILGIDVASVGSFWPDTIAVDDRVIGDVRAERMDDFSLKITFSIAEGVPYGTSFDLVLRSRTALTNTATITSAVILRPPQPQWVASKFYQQETTGADGELIEVTSVSEGLVTYATFIGVGLPVPLTLASNSTEARTVWAGFPVDGVADIPGKYLFVDANTGIAATDITVHSITIVKGYVSDVPTFDFPPTNFTPDSPIGETVFVSFTPAIGTYNKQYFFRAVETVDASLSVADAPILIGTAAVPVVGEFSIAPDIDEDAVEVKTITIDGFGFDNVAVSSESAGVSDVTLVSSTSTQVVFSCVTADPVEVVVTIENQDTGETVDVTWVVGDTNVPNISSVTPDTVEAYAYDTDVTVSVADVSVGALVSLSNGALPIRNLVVDEVGGEVTFNTDVLNIGGSNLTITVTNPNGETDTIVMAVTAPATPTISSFTYYATEADYGVTANPKGAEVGESGLLRIVGTGFRPGATVTSSAPTSLTLGEVTIISLTQIKVAYSIPYAGTVDDIVTITITDRDVVTSVNDTITLEEPTPIIAAVYGDFREGAGADEYPADAAVVTLIGQHFAIDGVSNVADVTVSSPGTMTTYTVDDDNTITIDRLEIDPDTADDPITITVESLNGKTGTYEVTVLAHTPPTLSAWTVHPTGGADPIVPIVVFAAAANHRIKFYGSDLTFITAELSGPFVGTGAVIGTPTTTFFEMSLPTIDAVISGDTSVILTLTVPGTTTPYTFTLFAITTEDPGVPDVDSVTPYNLYEGSRAATIEIVGDALASNAVATVELSPEFSEMMPLALSPTTGLRPATVTIVSQTTERIVAKVVLADHLANQRFELVLKDPTGATLVIDTFWLTVQPMVGRVRFDTPLPAISTDEDASNDLTYDLVDPRGGEYLEVFGGVSVTPVATGDPLSVRVQFDMPGTAGDEVEVRLRTSSGGIASIQRATTTAP
jgi:hypothetical protein